MKKITPSTRFKDVDDYLTAFPRGTRALLKDIRQTVRKAAPGAEEVISYNMPAYRQNGMLVYFAGFKEHVSLFPASKAVLQFKKELTPYAGSKGTIRFPLDKALPLGLISRIVKFRVKENQDKLKAKELIGKRKQ